MCFLSTLAFGFPQDGRTPCNLSYYHGHIEVFEAMRKRSCAINYVSYRDFKGFFNFHVLQDRLLFDASAMGDIPLIIEALDHKANASLVQV